MSQAAPPHDPAAGHPPPGAPIGIPMPEGGPIPNMSREQLLAIFQSIPGAFDKLPADGKEEALSNLQTAAILAAIPGHLAPPYGEPGPSSHPRGPPNLGQLTAAAMQANPVPQPQPAPDGSDDASKKEGAPATPTTAGGRGRNRGGAAMGTDEWTRQRKDNHKEVERRRRGNINEGINELGRIVPNGSGEKAKGAILSRAVQYIHHLKENEARNIEKWTLEKLLMDQAMGDLQAQLEEVRRFWEEERATRQRLEGELEQLRHGGSGSNGQVAGGKRPNEDADAGNDDGKRQRTE